MNTQDPILSFNDMRNIYPVSKTIAFRLVPDSRTQAYVEKNDIISNAKTLSRDRNTLKNAADRIHRRFIEETLSKLRLPYGMLQEYSDATEETDREKRKERLSELNAALKKHIATAFKDIKKGGKTGFLAALGGEELLKDLLPAEVNTDEEREALKRLQRYTTYLRPYMDTRARIYSENGGGNTIPNRIVDDNLPIILANVKAFKLMPQDIRDATKAIFDTVNPAWAQSIDEVFMLSYGCLLNAQSAIDAYNALIGGISAEDGSRIQGLNELVNLHNQQLPRDRQDKRLPRFRQLKKQILSEHETLSWVPQALQSDAEVMQVLDTIHEAYKGFNGDSLLAVSEADPRKTYIRADRLAAFSKVTFKDWRKAADCIKSALRDQNPRKAREGEEGYEKRIDKLFKSRESFSLQEILDAVRAKHPTEDLTGLSAHIKVLLAAAEVNHSRMLSKTGETDGGEPLRQQKEDKDNARTAIRLWLDTLIELCNIAAWFDTKDDADDKDPDWYDNAVYPWQDFRPVLTKGYNAVRNYLTRKPFSTEKLRIYFGAPGLLSGWAESKLPVSRGVILKKDGTPYLGILIDNKLFDDAPEDRNSPWSKLHVLRIAGASKSLAKVFQDKSEDGSGNLATYKPSKAVLDLYLATKRKERKASEYTPDEVKMMIEFYQGCLEKNANWSAMGITTRPAGEYKSMAEFFEDVDKQDFAPTLVGIEENYIEEAVSDGRLLLFQITCQDMSPAHHGKDGNHKVILEEMLSERNMAERYIKLLGDAAVYFRPKSLPRKVTHPAGIPIANKNPDAKTPTRTLAYDLIKDRRYTEDRWMLHLPVMLNPKADPKGENAINGLVNQYIREHPDMYVLGINRGERNLLSVAVTAPDGTIVEQRNLNVFDGYDYRKALTAREKKRDAQQKNWEQQTAIKDLKTGYLSRAVGEIVRLVKKYHCAVVLENLDMEFRDKRKKFEREVYARFEAALVGRLGLLMDKDDEDRLHSALQLTRLGQTAGERTRWNQNGIVFFLSPAWITKTDPLTGFANRLNTRYENGEKARAFIRAFDLIRYNSATDRFEFHFRYENFHAGKSAGDPSRTWCVETYGERIENTSDEKNGSPKDVHHDITAELKTLLGNQSVEYLTGRDIREDLAGKLSAAAWDEFYKCLRLTLQNTNWDSDTREYSVIGCTALNGEFYDSRYAPETMPKDADVSAARCLAMKAHMAMRNIREYDVQDPPRTNTGKIVPVKTYVTDEEWFLSVQK